MLRIEIPWCCRRCCSIKRVLGILFAVHVGEHVHTMCVSRPECSQRCIAMCAYSGARNTTCVCGGTAGGNGAGADQVAQGVLQGTHHPPRPAPRHYRRPASPARALHHAGQGAGGAAGTSSIWRPRPLRTRTAWGGGWRRDTAGDDTDGSAGGRSTEAILCFVGVENRCLSAPGTASQPQASAPRKSGPKHPCHAHN